MHPLIQIQELNSDNNTMGWVVLFISISLFITAILFFYWYYMDETIEKEICEDCEYDKYRVCKRCGTHELEKSIIK